MKRNESLLYDAHFREIFHRTVFIELKEMEPIASSVDVLPDANGVIAYGFQEERANMTFLVFASARLDEPEDESLPVTLTPGPAVHDTYLRFRYTDVENCQFLTEDKTRAALAAGGTDAGWLDRFEGTKDTVARVLEPQDPERRALLELELIDRSRNLAYPEFVSLTLYNGKLAPEMVWVRPVRMGVDGEFYGYLAHEPRGRYGLTTTDEIMFRAYDNGYGGIQLMWDGRAPEAPDEPTSLS
ncbi:MAG: hypothetical protein IJH91_03350 [Mogibacterium sp.]|nr:hypothetical protein [Mogibacterium sp.]